MPVRRYQAPLAILAWVFSGELGIAQEVNEPPDDALLEFLGEWESADGEWVDPLEFAEFELAEQGSERDCPYSDEECLDKRRSKDEG